MEKIYMEENKNNKKKKSVVDATVVLSFVVAIFAIVSLIAFGINEVSYAEPSDGTTDLGSGFTLHSSYTTTGYYYDYTSGGNAPTSVNRLWGDSKDVSLYCIEHGVGIVPNTAYSKGDELDDNPLMYILANGENYAKSQGVTDPEAIYWIVQSAIWVHMHNKYYGTTEAEKHVLTDVNNIKQATQIYKHIETEAGEPPESSRLSLGSATATPGEIVRKLVEDAEKYQEPIFSISVNACSELETLDNGDKRCLVTVAGNSISSYTVSLANSDLTGVFVGNKDRESLTDHVFNGSDENFYVYIPKAKLPSDESKTVRIIVNAKIEGLDGYVYAAADSELQKVVTARKTLTPVSDNDEFVVAPDTGINKVQTIYFIGLIVLLCGVGIIYANAKPVEIKQ